MLFGNNYLEVDIEPETLGAHMAAISAMNIACFDIKGKALSTPIWNLLGGKFRDRIPVYSSLVQHHLTPERDVEKVLARM